MERASNEELLTFEHHREWVKLLQSCKEHEAALACAQASAKRWPRSVDAWLLLLELLIARGPGAEDVLKAFEEALSAIPKQESPFFRARKISTLVAKSLASYLGRFNGVAVGGVCGDTGTQQKSTNENQKALFYPHDVCTYAKEKLLELHSLYRGYKAARKFYKRMLHLKPLSLAFFQRMIDMENSSAQPDADKLRSYFENAVAEFGETNFDLWMKYILFELKHPEGKPEQAGVLYHRAVKTLHDDLTDHFISAYSLLDTSKS
ncbi:hypothetical protein HPB49_007553 [Dermacentor silvarum]|uniref:Uncharacterized protein n=1 Tax=Dermacentor silvarum TaxID=543639 RepID=A0ACB8C7X8_DERSI|nr:hypothetical protein HPB49_007553 [Dermacentor silvarum]